MPNSFRRIRPNSRIQSYAGFARKRHLSVATYRLILLGAGLMALSSCACVTYQKTVIFEKSTNIDYVEGFLGSKAVVEDRRVGVAMQIASSPDYDYLLISAPVIPLPIFPWVPGIYNVSVHRDRYGFKNEQFKIALIFSDPRKQKRLPKDVTRATEFVFSPRDVKLHAGSKLLSPSTLQWRFGGCRPERGCSPQSDGKFLITYAALQTALNDPDCFLTYDILASDVQHAQLTIENLAPSDKNVPVIALIKPASFHMGVIGP